MIGSLLNIFPWMNMDELASPDLHASKNQREKARHMP
jgi:hypothetical protein